MTTYEISEPIGVDGFEITQHVGRVGREAMLAFVRAHGVDVNDVPLPSTVTVDGARGQVTFEVVARDERGREVVLDDLSVKRTSVTVPQRAVTPW